MSSHQPRSPAVRSLLAAAGLAAFTTAGVAACGGERPAAGTDSTAMAPAPAAGAPMAGDSAGMMAPGTGTTTSASLGDPSTGAQLDSVATAARGGLTALAPSVAVPLIRSLEDKLDASNDPALTDIAKDLEKLREELADDTVDGGDVGEILERLGPKVTNVAAKGGAAQGTLQAIGSELTKAATQLRGSR